MSHDHHNETNGVVKNYTLTAFLSFAMMFCLFILLSNCHGDYKGVQHHSSEHKTEAAEPQHGNHH